MYIKFISVFVFVNYFKLGTNVEKQGVETETIMAEGEGKNFVINKNCSPPVEMCVCVSNLIFSLAAR